MSFYSLLHKFFWVLTSSSAPPVFQDKETVFYQMTQFVKVFVVLALLFAILFWRNYGLHTC